jgi:uncharacterized membrane protein
VLWLVIGWIMFLTVLGIPVAWVIWVATGLWVLYRLIRGWLALADRKPIWPMGGGMV